jgi:hypothetical protein
MKYLGRHAKANDTGIECFFHGGKIRQMGELGMGNRQ